MKKQEQTPQFYTQEGINVTKRIDDGLTQFTKSKKQAEKMAFSRNSYHYEIYDNEPGSNRNHIGFGIPK